MSSTFGVKSPQQPNALVWFRRDLRVRDNLALNAAITRVEQTGGLVTCCFVLDPRLLKSASPNREAFLYRALRSLQANGVKLVVVAGDPVSVISQMADDLRADVFVSADAGPYGRIRDQLVEAALAVNGKTMIEADSPYLVTPGTVRKGDGTPYKVFTPFSRVWILHANGQRPAEGNPLASDRFANPVDLGVIPNDPAGVAAQLPAATEAAAHSAAQTFLSQRMHAYEETRNVPSLDSTSRLGAYLKYGLLHPRQLLSSIESAIQQGSEGARVFRSELCWREFYADVLWHRPDSARHNYMTNMEIAPDTGTVAEQRFVAWCEGRTGYPFIDAGMRQLVTEGWMHNRVRMAVASFLVKDLHLDWQRGAAFFMAHLVDGDLASNQHGWQWTAGTGTDASPYYRVFNPVSQGKKFDPDGAYVRRYVPELAPLGSKFIHEPWLQPPSGDLFNSSGTSYPSPIVDHGVEREEALARYKSARGDNG
jgi:deoxyribodipyrimidine photo-lyase